VDDPWAKKRGPEPVRRTARQRRRTAAKVAGLLTVVMLVLGVPSVWVSSLPGYSWLTGGVALEWRFESSRGAFDATVRDLPPPVPAEDGWETLDLPGEIGGYSISQAVRLQGEAVLLFTTEGPPWTTPASLTCPTGRKPSTATGPSKHPRGSRSATTGTAS
jgi:hypothetical protein